MRLPCRKSDNGFDANKKVKGIKRNIAVDRNGFILGRCVSNAGIHDSVLRTLFVSEYLTRGLL